jgi:hypothetical protein
MAFVSTLGASDANSYLSVTKASTLLAEIPASTGVTAWLALTDTQKEQTLVAATMAIDPLHWKGQRATQEQSLSWPRVMLSDSFYIDNESLPIDFSIGVAYMAAFLGSNGGYTGIQSLDGGNKRYQNSEYEEVELGKSDLRVKFDKSGMAQSGMLFIPPFSMDIFSKYMIRGEFYQPRVRRESVARIGYYGLNRGFRQHGTRLIDGKLYPYGSGWMSRF